MRVNPASAPARAAGDVTSFASRFGTGDRLIIGAAADGKGTVLKHVPLGEAYDIPLRCLLPRSVENLLVAGRCISGTHEAHSSYRVMPIVMATGQAAGVCAAFAARTNRAPRAVPVQDVQRELVRQGASLAPSVAAFA